MCQHLIPFHCSVTVYNMCTSSHQWVHRLFPSSGYHQCAAMNMGVHADFDLNLKIQSIYHNSPKVVFLNKSDHVLSCLHTLKDQFADSLNPRAASPHRTASPSPHHFLLPTHPGLQPLPSACCPGTCHVFPFIMFSQLTAALTTHTPIQPLSAFSELRQTAGMHWLAYLGSVSCLFCKNVALTLLLGAGLSPFPRHLPQTMFLKERKLLSPISIPSI